MVFGWTFVESLMGNLDRQFTVAIAKVGPKIRTGTINLAAYLWKIGGSVGGACLC